MNEDDRHRVYRSGKGSYGVVVDGHIFQLEYEEMVELLAAGKASTYGNEYLESMRTKVKEIWNSVPVSSY